VTFTLALDIAAPPRSVFDFVADFTTIPRWYSAVSRVERLDGNGALGTRYRVHRHLPGGPATNEVEITELSDGDAITFTSTSGPTPFRYRYQVRATGTGTHLTLEGSISGQGLTGPAALLAPFAEGFFHRGMRDNLGALARILEH